jgi:staphylococcal nuclease domain-containing protein 1
MLNGTLYLYKTKSRQAKARKLNLWRGHTAKAPQTTSSFEAIALRIINGDTIEVAPKQGGARKTIQLSSVRQPKTTDPKQAAWQAEVKEYLRKRIIGKTVYPLEMALISGTRSNRLYQACE